MANYSSLKDTIDNNIIPNNGEGLITGSALNQVLKAAVDSLGAGYLFMGVAAENTNPGSPDQNVFYIAGPGTYTHFGIIVPEGELGILKWNGMWSLQTIEGLGGGGANLTGYVAVDSVANLPDPGEDTLGYLVGTDLYLYVGTGGDTLGGKYQNCGPFRGPAGEDGTNGTNGSNGAPGKSAYQIWLDEGNVGTEADFLASLQGNSGYTGAAGELEVVNNLTDGGAAKALSAEMGRTLNARVYGGQVGVSYTQADTTIYLTKNGAVVSETSANRIRVVLPVKAGDEITLKMSLGQGAAASIYATIDECLSGAATYLQTLSYTFTTSEISGTAGYDGYLCVSLAKTGNSNFSSGESATYVNSLSMSVVGTRNVPGSLPAIDNAIYGEEETRSVLLTEDDADITYTNNGSEVSQVTSANRVHFIYYIPVGATIDISCEINSGVAVSVYSTRANALQAGNNYLESYTSGGYSQSVQATSTKEGWLNLNYKNSSGGTLSQQDLTDVLAAISIEIRYNETTQGAGIISRLDKLESHMESGESLYVGNVVQGSRGSTKINGNAAQVAMANTCGVPFEGCRITAHLPSGIVADLLTGTTSQTLSAAVTLEDGDAYTFPDNIIYYSINFRKDSGDSLLADDATAYIGNGSILFTLDNGDGTEVQGRNSYNEVFARAPMRLNQLKEYGAYLSIAHVSDFHSDAVRAVNFFKECEHLGVQYAIHTGDIVGWPYNGSDFFFEAMSKFSGKTINTTGNHDVFGLDYADIFAANIEPIVSALEVSTDKCYFYYDDSTYKVRFIVLDVFENAKTNGNNEADITGTQMNWLITTLASVPANYGVILCYHAPADAILSNDLGFYQDSVSYYKTLDDYGTGVKNSPIQKIVNAFIRRESISDTYTSHGTSYSYSADFSSVPSSAEFICHLTGHEHSDRIGYYTGYDGQTTGQEKQLVFNICCGNALYGTAYRYLAHLSDCPRGGKGSVQDAFNVLTIYRDTHKIRVTRIGSFMSSDGSERLTAIFEYR